MTASRDESSRDPVRPSLLSRLLAFWVGLERGWQASILGVLVVAIIFAF